MAQITSGRFVLGIKIEGVGDVTAPTATDQRTRFVTARSFLDDPSVTDPDNLYENGLMFWPSEIGQTVDFIAGESTLGTQTFELQMTESIQSTLFRYKHNFSAKHVTVNGINTTATVVFLSGSTLVAGEVVYIRREAWAIVSDDGAVGPVWPGVRQYTISRGALETQAVPHGTSPRDNVEVYRTLRVLEARGIELFRVDMDAAAYDEEVVWSGIVRSVSAAGPERLTISTDSVIGLLSANKLMKNQWKGKVTAVNDDSGYKELLPIGSDPLRRMHVMDAVSFGGDSALIQVKGAGAMVARDVVRQISAGFAKDTLLLEPGVSLERFNIAPGISFSELKDGGEAYEILSSNGQQPFSSLLDPDDPFNLPLASNPAVLVLQILLSTRSDELNANGAQPYVAPQSNHPVYDTGIGNISAGIPASLVDVAAIEAWGTRRFGSFLKNIPDIGVDCFHLGIDGKSESAAAVIRDILHPFSAILVVGRAGQLKIVDLADALSYGSTNAIVQDDILTPPTPTQDRRLEAAVETIQATYNMWPEFKGDSLEFRDVFNRDQLPDGWGDAPDFDVPIASEAVCRMWIERLIHKLHIPIPLIVIETLRTVDYHPGDVVTLTHEHLLGPDGTRGLVDAVMLVASRTEVLSDQSHIIRYELLYVGFNYNRVGYIAPSAKIQGYSPGAGTATLTLDVNSFTDSVAGPFRRDVPAASASAPWQTGDSVQIVDQYGTVTDAALTIQAVSADTLKIDLPAAPPNTTPGQEDIVRIAAYDSGSSGQNAVWIYVAGDDNLLGAAGDDPYEYVFAEGG